MSTTAVAQPCERLAMRTISPLRMYQTTPLPSRSRVTRSVTSSTVPIASPVSMTSPTPYWSSMIMKMPDRKSLTRLCAPKPERHAADAGRGQQRAERQAEQAHDGEDRHRGDGEGGRALEDGAHRGGPLPAPLRGRSGRRRQHAGGATGQALVPLAGPLHRAADDAVDRPVQQPSQHDRADDGDEDAQAVRGEPGDEVVGTGAHRGRVEEEERHGAHHGQRRATVPGAGACRARVAPP